MTCLFRSTTGLRVLKELNNTARDSVLVDQISYLNAGILSKFYWFALIISISTNLFALFNNTWQVQLPFSIATVSLSIIGLGIKKPIIAGRFFLLCVFLFTLFLTYVKFRITNASGSGAIQTLIEFSLSITVIYYFGLRKSFWLPLLFILTSVLRLYLMQTSFIAYMQIVETEFLRLNITATVILLYFLSISDGFRSRIISLFDSSSQVLESLERSKKRLEVDNLALQEAYKQIEDMATINSHRLRAPIARIQGLVHLINSLQEEQYNDELPVDLSSEINRSLQELEDELNSFKSLIRSVS